MRTHTHTQGHTYTNKPICNLRNGYLMCAFLHHCLLELKLYKFKF